MKETIAFTAEVRKQLPHLEKAELRELVEDLLTIIQEDARVRTETLRIVEGA